MDSCVKAKLNGKDGRKLLFSCFTAAKKREKAAQESEKCFQEGASWWKFISGILRLAYSKSCFCQQEKSCFPASHPQIPPRERHRGSQESEKTVGLWCCSCEALRKREGNGVFIVLQFIQLCVFDEIFAKEIKVEVEWMCWKLSASGNS